MVSSPLQSLDMGRDKQFGLPPTVTALGASREATRGWCVYECVTERRSERGREGGRESKKEASLVERVFQLEREKRQVIFWVAGSYMLKRLKLQPNKLFHECKKAVASIWYSLFPQNSFAYIQPPYFPAFKESRMLTWSALNIT